MTESNSPYADWTAVQFPTVRKGGYDRAAVEAYVDRAAREIATLTGKLGGVIDTVAHAESGAGAAARVLALAEHVAGEVRAAAEVDAEATRAAAIDDAREIRAAAEVDAEATRAAAESEAAEIRAREEERLTADLEERAAAAAQAQADADDRLAATTAAADRAAAELATAEQRLAEIRTQLRAIATYAAAAADDDGTAPLDPPVDPAA